MRYVAGHNGRKQTRYVEEDRGHATPCWIWQLSVNRCGYGNLRVGDHKEPAHRWHWEQVNGLVPEGLEMDHLCRVRSCVNPEHLEPVTHAENMRRSAASRRA
jgi:hypothetical protein